MTIFVYEPDPFIRDDIVETLSSGMKSPVKSVTNTDALPASDTAVYVMSMTRAEVEDSLQELLGRLTAGRVVLICGDVSENSTQGVAVRINKPFGSEDLINAVRSIKSPAPSL